MTEQEMQAMRAMMEDVVSKGLEPVNEKLSSMDEKIDHLTFQVDTLYKWVDGIDIDVKSLKKAQ